MLIEHSPPRKRGRDAVPPDDGPCRGRRRREAGALRVTGGCGQQQPVRLHREAPGFAGQPRRRQRRATPALSDYTSDWKAIGQSVAAQLSNPTKYAMMVTAFPPAQAGGGVPVPSADGPRRGHVDAAQDADAHAHARARIPWRRSAGLAAPLAAPPIRGRRCAPGTRSCGRQPCPPRPSRRRSARREGAPGGARARAQHPAPGAADPAPMTRTLLSTLPKAKRLGSNRPPG